MDNISDKLSRQIRQKSQELHRLNQAVMASLPKDCHEHVEVAGINDNQLIVLTDSPVWQTRLRMFSQTMLEALHQHTGIKLTRVKLRLSPAQRIVEEEAPARRKLSQHSANVIEQAASCISDPELQKAMQRLSKKAK